MRMTLQALTYEGGQTTAPSKPKQSKKKPTIPPEEDIPVSEDGKAVSEEEYWEKYYEHPDFTYEWDNGLLEEVHAVSDFEGYLEVNPIGETVGLEFGFRMALPHKTAIRKPDLAVVLNSHPAMLHRWDKSFR